MADINFRLTIPNHCCIYDPFYAQSLAQACPIIIMSCIPLVNHVSKVQSPGYCNHAPGVLASSLD